MYQKKISDITLERYLLKEMNQVDMDELEALLKENPELQARLQALKKSTEKILSQYDPGYFAMKISDNLKSETENQNLKEPVNKEIPSGFSNSVYFWFHKKRHFFPALFSAVVVMTIIILILPPNIQQPSTKQGGSEIDDEAQINGGTLKLFIYRKKNREIELLTTNTMAKKGDLLQIAYFSAKESYGMIFSIDGRANVKVHYPQIIKGKDQTFEKLQANEKVLLPVSYELDDAPAYEEFFLLASGKKINIEETLNAIKEQVSSDMYKKNKILKLDPSLTIESLLLNKVK